MIITLRGLGLKANQMDKVEIWSLLSSLSHFLLNDGRVLLFG